MKINVFLLILSCCVMSLINDLSWAASPAAIPVEQVRVFIADPTGGPHFRLPREHPGMGNLAIKGNKTYTIVTSGQGPQANISEANLHSYTIHSTGTVHVVYTLEVRTTKPTGEVIFDGSCRCEFKIDNEAGVLRPENPTGELCPDSPWSDEDIVFGHPLKVVLKPASCPSF